MAPDATEQLHGRDFESVSFPGSVQQHWQAAQQDWQAAQQDWQAALDLQADQDIDVEEVEVFHQLKQMAAPSLFPGIISQMYCQEAATTLVATVALSPTFTARAQGRPLSSFHRSSVRASSFIDYNRDTYYYDSVSTTQLHKAIPNVSNTAWPLLIPPRLVNTSTTEEAPAVIWHMQVDFVDLVAPVTNATVCLGKRRRALNPFQQVSPEVEETSRVDHIPEVKRFKGVRYRPERRTWVAEMKPPKSKNKVSFGDFKSQTQAARAIDAAFHHYGKLVNFPDTPQILSSRPSPAGLDEKDKLNLVKQQAKWLASIASTLPCTPTSATRATLAFCSSPQTTPLSLGGSDINEERRRLSQGSVENAVLIPCSPARRSSSTVHITDQGDCYPEYSNGALTSFVDSPALE